MNWRRGNYHRDVVIRWVYCRDVVGRGHRVRGIRGRGKIPRWRRIRVECDSSTRKKIEGLSIKMFKEGDVKGVEDGAGGHIPQAIGFGVRRVPNEDARARALIYLRIMGLDEGKGMAANFAKVG